VYTLRALVEPKTLPPSAVDPKTRSGGQTIQGIIVVFSHGEACTRVMRLTSGTLELGRGATATGDLGKLDDGRVSRRHALVAFDGGRCMVTDLGSQNGTFVDGKRISGELPSPIERVLRVGDTLLIPCADVEPFERHGVQVIDDLVRGPAMLAVLDEAARAARAGSTLHLRGETGTGKEGVAHAFHCAGPRAAKPTVAVNCAAIPPGIAERLLFGSKRGAFSGAVTDAPGYIQEAEGGTLFLDEIAELDLQVQAKLLRVLESDEVMAVGASRPRKIDFGLCTATAKDLRALIAAGTFRDDLYFRIGIPAITLPPLRKRPEEIPALIAQELARQSSTQVAHVSLVEQCLLRPWPGNVRELLAEVRSAAHAARPHGNRVEASHLAAWAGSVLGKAMPDAMPRVTGEAREPSPDRPRSTAPRIDDEWLQRIGESLRSHAGNVTATARALGMHRTQLRRLLERHGISSDDDPDGTSSAK
jgi:DNA-binding NtrC family response regulator